MKPTVSVIVPSFKRVEQTLITLELLLMSHGWGKDFVAELIVADCTPNDSLKQAIEKKFGSRVIYTRPMRAGIATNKNQGAKVATGKILIFCDSDIEVEPETISNTVAGLQRHAAAGMIGGTVVWKGGERHGLVDRPEDTDRTHRKEGTTFIEVLYSRFVGTYSDVFWQVGGYDENVFNMRGEGSDLSTRYWRSGFPLVHEEAVTVHHVFDAPDSVAIRVEHPEWDIARDFFLLAKKYQMEVSEASHFSQTIERYYDSFGNTRYSRLLEGIMRHHESIDEAEPFVKEFIDKDKPLFDFKFLEVFSDSTKLKDCVITAPNRLQPIRSTIF